jgi:hypothetical protein
MNGVMDMATQISSTPVLWTGTVLILVGMQCSGCHEATTSSEVPMTHNKVEPNEATANECGTNNLVTQTLQRNRAAMFESIVIDALDVLATIHNPAVTEEQRAQAELRLRLEQQRMLQWKELFPIKE